MRGKPAPSSGTATPRAPHWRVSSTPSVAAATASRNTTGDTPASLAARHTEARHRGPCGLSGRSRMHDDASPTREAGVVGGTVERSVAMRAAARSRAAGVDATKKNIEQRPSYADSAHTR